MSLFSGLKNIFVKEDRDSFQDIHDILKDAENGSRTLPASTTSTVGTFTPVGAATHWNSLTNEESAELVQLEKQREEMVKALRLKDFKSSPAKDREAFLSIARGCAVMDKLEAYVDTELDIRINTLNNKRGSFIGAYYSGDRLITDSDITNRLKNIDITIEDLEKAHVDALMEEELRK